MKKFITPFVAILLLFCASYAAAQTVTFSMNNVTVDRGQQICIPVKVSGFTSIVGFQFSLSFDPTALQFVSVQNINLPDLQANSNNFGFPGSGNVPNGKITVLWTDNTFQGITKTDGATIFELCFTVLNSANSTKVEFSNSPTSQDVFNANSQNLTFSGQGSNVTVNGSTSSTPFKLIASNKTVTQGQQVCVDITAEGFDSIGTTKYTLQYDTTKLQFVSVGSFNLPGMTNASFGLPGTNGVPKGRITVNWTNSPASTAGVTRASGAVLFQVCFTATNTGSASVSFTNSPQAQSVTKGNGNAVTFNGQNGTVTINSNGGGGNSNTFKVIMSDTTAASGATVCLSVKSQGFNAIATMSYTIQFDQTKLQYISTGQYNASLSGFSAQSFGTPGTGGVPQGKLTVLWDDPAAQGITLPDGSVLFQVCFKILAASGSTPVSFVGTPTPIEVLKVVNGNLQPETFSSQAGTVTVGTGGGSGSLKFTIADKTVQSGQQVCVDVTVDNMKDIIGITLGVQYDPTKLQFVSVGQFGLPDLTAAQFGTPTSSPPTNAGLVTMVWFDNAVAGVSRPNGTVIFQLCFTAIGANGTTATLSFTGTPTAAMNVDNINEDPEPFTTKSGTVTIGGSTGTPLSLPIPSITSVNCYGQSTGAINITPQGGSGNYTYQWSNGASSQDLNNIPAGSYSVTVTDATTNLTVSGIYNVSQPGSALSATPTITNIACGAGANSGGISLAVSGGTSPYQYNWSGSLQDNIPAQTSLPAGTYSVTITDNRSCTLALTNLNVTAQSTVQVTMVPTNISQQGNNGAVSITPTGGTGIYTYAWSGPNNYTSTQKNISGLSTPGQYCVTVTDNQGCSASNCTTITQPLSVTGQANRVCNGASNGSITLTVLGGFSPYSYKWSNGAMTQNLNNVSAGTYRVTVTDSQNTTATGDFEVSSYPAVTLSAQITPASSGVSNGKIVLTVGGGTGPYTVNWSNNATTTTISNLAAGQYCVTATDSKGCNNDDCYTVQVQDLPLAVTDIVITGVTCANDKNGTLAFKINGGRAPYTITFSDNTTIPNSAGVVSKDNLSGGAFSFTITDDAGGTLTKMVTIPAPTPIQVSNVIVVHDSEESGCTGSISATFTGGKPPYFVQWNAPNTGTGSQIINLCEGNFVPTVRDDNGCIQTLPAIQVTTFRASGAALATACPQDTTGMVALNVSGGTKPYAFSWKNAAGMEISTADTLKNVPPGVYTVRVSEKSGNVLNKQFTIVSTSNLNADVNVISDYNGTDISCPSATDGILEATGKSGSGNYTYEWRKGTSVLGTTPVIQGAGAGTYQVAVKDGLGCTVTKQVTVVPPDTIQLTASIQQISCAGKTDGGIVVTASGGANGKPYSFAWSTGTTGALLLQRNAGTYTVTATDANNCVITKSFILEEPKPLQVKVETQPATDNCNGTALATVEGGTAPYTYKWNASNATSQIINELCAGSYVVMVTDSRGCTAPTATGIVGEAGNPDCLVDKMVITPEGDGVNEDFRVSCNDNANNHLEVYNRWGQLVFQADNYVSGWQGTTQSGDPLPDGAYYFVLEFTNSNGKLVQQKGSLTILRGK